MSWLVAQDHVLATLEIAETWQDRMRGVLGRESLDGALMLKPARSVHTLGVKFALDVAFLDGDMQVVDIVTMVPNRLGMPRRKARVVIEAPKGSFERWHVVPGDVLEVRQ